MPRNDREVHRRKVLNDLAILDSAPEREFQALADLARKLLGTKIALLSLADADRQWFKAKCGIDLSEIPRAPSFCSVAVETDTPLIVADMHADPRFFDNPFVVGEPHVRFYAGIPVHARTPEMNDPVAVGSFCVMDDVPREISADQIASLESLAAVAEALIEARAVALRASLNAEERRLAMERSERGHRQLKQAERIADIGSWRLSLADNHVEWSDGVFAIHELPLGFQPPVEKALDHYPEPDRTRVANAIARAVETGEPLQIEADFVTAKRNKRRVRILGEIELLKGMPVALIGVFQDITERHRMEEALRHSARTDDLTGLANRAEFYRVLEGALMDGRSGEAELAVLLIDLDGFKQVNDTFGHAAGDEVLRRVGDRLRAPEMARCSASRLGGDEFAVIVNGPNCQKDFGLLLDQLLESLRIEVVGAGTELRVTGSIGIAWSNSSTLSRQELLRRADAALYEVKRTRKGTAWTYGTAPALSMMSD